MSRRRQRKVERPKNRWGRFSGIRRFPRRMVRTSVRAATRLFRICSAPFILLLTAFRKAGSWLYRWSSSRDGRCFVRGIPALIVILGCAYLAVARQIEPPEDALQRYSQAAQRAMESRDYRAAAILWERTLQLDPRNTDGQFQLALAVAENRETERFEFLMAGLAPQDHAVYAPAHLLQAKRILGKGTVSAAELQRAEAQLLRVIHLQPSQLEAQALLGQLYLSSGRPDLAEPHLILVARAAPAMELPLAKAHSLQGHVREADRIGRRAEEYFRRQVERNSNDLQARLNWAEALMFLEEYSRAVDVLSQGMVLSEDRIFRRALARVQIAWADSLAKRPGSTPGEQFKLLEAGLRADPNEMMLFDRIMRLIQSSSDTAGQVRQSLIECLARGEAPALIHLLLGTEAGERGDTEQALQHLKRAHEIDPNMSIVANNLAWFMAHADPPELSKSLALIETVTERWPKVPEFRDTRGQIRLKRGDWEGALSDFEFALPAMANNRRLHESLAKVYRQLNVPDLAAQHERLAKTLEETGESN